MTLRYHVFLTPIAREMLTDISDRRIQVKIRERIDNLADNPLKLGKPLTGELIGFRSLRAVGQRYRILYRVEQQRVTVAVVAIGIRKEGDKEDIYRLAQKLLRLKLL